MRNHLRGQVILPQCVAELRTYVWDGSEAYTFDDSNYQILRVHSHTPRHQTMRWRLQGKIARPVRGTSVIPARTPLTLEVGAGEINVISCLFPPDHFEEIAKVDRWTDELTVSCLSLRNTFVAAVLDRLAEEIADPTDNSEMLYDALAAALRAEAPNLVPREDRVRSQPGGLTKWQIDKIFEAIRQNSPESGELAMQELAASCGISVRHMMRGFKATTGSTIYHYVRRHKLDRAIELIKLHHSTLTLGEIGKRAGFSTSSHFSKEFLVLTGSTPRQFRARLKGNVDEE